MTRHLKLVKHKSCSYVPKQIEGRKSTLYRFHFVKWIVAASEVKLLKFSHMLENSYVLMVKAK